MTTKEILIAARDLISDHKRWTKNTTARNKDSEPVGYEHPEAVRFCASGALRRVAPQYNGIHRARSELNEAAKIVFGKRIDIIDLNDKPAKEGGGYKKVMEAYDVAIAKLDES